MRFLRQRGQRRKAESSGRPMLPRKRPWADPGWLAWQTLTYSGSAQIKTAGVTYHANDLRAAAARYGRLVMAELRIEEKGRYAGAVRVFVGGTQLGSIPHDLTPEFREVIFRLSDVGEAATCRAQLDADPGEYVDVWLSAKPRERAADDPFLPPMLGARVQLPADVVEYLDDVILGGRAKSKRVVRTGELVQRDGVWVVLFEGRELGMLPDRRYPRLNEAREAGFPLTCQIRVLRQPARPLRVEADFPTC